MLKIISGKYKNRTISPSKNFKFRPSTAKLREAVFSILSSGDFIENRVINEARVLDLYSAVGLYAFEALSRGASKITLVDIELEYLKIAQNFAKSIGQLSNITCLNLNCITLPKSSYKYNLIFIDPPYNSNLMLKTIESLAKKNWLEDNAVLVLEMSKTDNFSFPNNFTIKTEKIYGDSKLVIMKFYENQQTLVT